MATFGKNMLPDSSAFEAVSKMAIKSSKEKKEKKLNGDDEEEDKKLDDMADLLEKNLVNPKTVDALSKAMKNGTKSLENMGGENAMLFGLLAMAFIVLIKLEKKESAARIRKSDSEVGLNNAKADKIKAEAEKIRAETQLLKEGKLPGKPGEVLFGYDVASATAFQDLLREAAKSFVPDAKPDDLQNGITVVADGKGNMTIDMTEVALRKLKGSPFAHMRRNCVRVDKDGKSVWRMEVDGTNATSKGKFNDIMDAVRNGRKLRADEQAYKNRADRLANSISVRHEDDGTYTVTLAPRIDGAEAEKHQAVLRAQVKTEYPALVLPPMQTDAITITDLSKEKAEKYLTAPEYIIRPA